MAVANPPPPPPVPPVPAPTAHPRQNWILAVVIVVLLIFYLWPLEELARELSGTDSYTGLPDFSAKMSRALEDFDDLDTVLRRVLIPLVMGLSAGLVVARTVSKQAITLFVILVAALVLSIYVFVSLHSEPIAGNWEMHGFDPKNLQHLQQYTRQAVDSFLAYLALLAGVSISQRVGA